MISYAQNFEDVILERLFKGKKTGFYVDIGACHPIYDSVTHHFYLKGWSGINVEPQPKLFTELKAARERDINLQCCVGAQAGSRTLYITRDVGTSTLNQVIAEHYREEQSIDQELIVELVTLDHIWSRHVGDRQVDFMKIDVEGYERAVLSGADFSRIAPSVLIIEATVPNSQKLCHEQWEELVLDNYELIYFDGLNRFYARKGSQFDTGISVVPPNIFDHFEPYPHVLLQQTNESLTLDNEVLRQQIQTILAQLSRKGAALDDASHAYEDLLVAYAEKERALQSLTLDNEVLRQQVKTIPEQLSRKDAALDDAGHSYEKMLVAYAEKERALQSLTLDNEVLRQQIKTIPEQLLRKDAALDDASHAYENLLVAYEQKDRDLQSLALDNEVLQQRIKTILEQLSHKDAALDDASHAYENLLVAYEQKERDLQSLLATLQTKEDALRNMQEHLGDGDGARLLPR